MKKFIAIMMAAMMFTMLAGCGNSSIGLGNYTFEKVHVDTHHYSGCFTVKKWYGSESGIEVLTKEVGSMFLSEGTYILMGGEEECPFCAEKDWSDILFTKTPITDVMPYKELKV